MEPIFEYLHKHSKQCDQYKYLEWTSHSVLQLQRQGHETLGLGTWEKCIEKVPICGPDEIIGIIDITDGTHPLLRRPSFDIGASGVMPDKPAQTVEAVDRDDSTGDQDEGQENGEQRADQTAAHEDIRLGGSDTSSNTTMAPSPQLDRISVLSAERTGAAASPPDNTTAPPSVHMDEGSPSTAERAQESASH